MRHLQPKSSRSVATVLIVAALGLGSISTGAAPASALSASAAASAVLGGESRGSEASATRQESGEAEKAEPSGTPTPNPSVLPTPSVQPTQNPLPTPNPLPMAEGNPEPADSPTEIPGLDLAPLLPPSAQEQAESDAVAQAQAQAQAQAKAQAAVATPAQTAPPQPPAAHVSPAPASREKEVIGAVHTDSLNAVWEADNLALRGRWGNSPHFSHFDPRNVINQLEDNNQSRQSVPADSAYRFLGEAGAPMWLIPQTQNYGLIWAGWSTEDLVLPAGETLAKAGGKNEAVTYELLGVDGPGKLEVFQTDSFGHPIRVFSGGDSAVRQRSESINSHVHANWAFTERGRYEITFRLTGKLNSGRDLVSPPMTYVFVVGDVIPTTTTVSARVNSSVIDRGDELLVTATLRQTNAKGWVEFFDGENLIGSAELVSGKAAITTSTLLAGERSLTARFVPTWANEYTAATSNTVEVTVRGETVPKPTTDDSSAPDREALSPSLKGGAVRIDEDRVPQNTTVLVRVGGVPDGDWVSPWLYRNSGAPEWQGWTQVVNGGFTIRAAKLSQGGDHRVAVNDRFGRLLGWDAVAVDTASRPQPSPVIPERETPGAVAAPTAGEQSCSDSIVLENGHIDYATTLREGKLESMIKEDVTGHQVLREPARVVMWLKPEAKQTAPGGAFATVAAQGAPIWVIPQTQNPALVWLGWSTEKIDPTQVVSDYSWTLDGFTGPGDVTLYSQASFGGIGEVYFQVKNGQITKSTHSLPGSVKSHVHSNWAFTEQGVYRLTFTQSVTLANGTRSSDTETVTIAVGDLDPTRALCGGSVQAATVTDDERAAAAAAAAEAAAAAAVQLSDGKAAVQSTPGATPTAPPNSLASLLNGEASPAAYALIGGGLLAIAGIVVGTRWFIRRRNRELAALTSGMPGGAVN